MAHYVMGDIHGEADRFHAMLKKIQFSEDDILILLGDVIDRGPDGITLLLEIMEMSNVIMLLGNHEYMMLQYLSPDATDIEIRRWNKNGNAPTLAAYLKQKGKVQQRMIAYLRSIPTHLDIEVAGKRFYMEQQATEMFNRISQCQSYDSALSIIGDYVNITSVEQTENMDMEMQ